MLLRLLRIAAWAGILVLAIASWTPGQNMVRTGMSGMLEHAIAYWLTGIVLMCAYPRKSAWILALALACYATVLELGQMWVPGRFAGLSDWLSGAVGALAAAPLADPLRRRLTPRL